MGKERSIILLGGGAGGLLTALILARGGHEVIVLERDAAPPPESDEEAWERWERRGVPQFRQPHGLTSRCRSLFADELPALASDIDSIAPVYELAGTAPDSAGLTDNDREIAMTMVRRPTLERLLATAADEQVGVEIRRGVTATGLLEGVPVNGRTNVVGVSTDGGEALYADLVVDCAGRRSPVGSWLTDLGAPIEESAESDGFTYASRWFRLDRQLPSLRAGTFAGLGPGLIALVFPADANAFAIAMVGSARDPLFRRVQRAEHFMRVAREFPLLGEWLEPGTFEPISDMLPMGSIQNRHLRLRRTGTAGPVGIVNTSDSYVSTNPSLGRGLGITGDLAVRLRTVLASDDDPERIVDAWDDVQQRFHRPWLDDSIAADANTRAAFEAMTDQPTATVPYPWRTNLMRAASVDMACWRAFTEVNQILATPSRWTEDPALLERAAIAAAEVPDPSPTMSRTDLDALTS